jgi:hypothetical protein
VVGLHFAVVTKALSFPDPKAVIIKVSLSSNAVSPKMPISHSILNVSRGLDNLFFRPHRFLPLLSYFHPKPMSIPRRYPDLLPPSNNCLPSLMRNLYFPRHRPFLIINLHQQRRDRLPTPPTKNTLASSLSYTDRARSTETCP